MTNGRDLNDEELGRCAFLAVIERIGEGDSELEAAWLRHVRDADAIKCIERSELVLARKVTQETV